MKNLLIALFLVIGLFSFNACKNFSFTRKMMSLDKVTIPAKAEMNFEQTGPKEGEGYLVVSADTTYDGIPDIKIRIKKLEIVRQICFLRKAYPDKKIALYGGIIIKETGPEWKLVSSDREEKFDPIGPAWVLIPSDGWAKLKN